MINDLRPLVALDRKALRHDSRQFTDSEKKAVFRLLEKNSAERSFEDVQAIVPFLEQIFQELAGHTKKLEQLAKCMELVKLKEGDSLFFAGDVQPRQFYVVLQGRVAVLQPLDLIQASNVTSFHRSFPREKNMPRVHSLQINLAKSKDAAFLFNSSDRQLYETKQVVGKGTQFGMLSVLEDCCRTYAAIAAQPTFVGALSRTNYISLFKEQLMAEQHRIRDILRCIFPQDIKKLFQVRFQMQELSFQFNERVYGFDEPVRGVYYLVEGEVKLIGRGSKSKFRVGKENALTHISAKEVFGMQEFVMSRQVSPALNRVYKAVATTSAKALFFPLDKLCRILKDEALLDQTIAMHQKHVNFLNELSHNKRKVDMLLLETSMSYDTPAYSQSIQKLMNMVETLRLKKEASERSLMKLPIVVKHTYDGVRRAFDRNKISGLSTSRLKKY